MSRGLYSLRNLRIYSGRITRSDEWAAKDTFQFKWESLHGGSACKYWGCGRPRPGFRTWLGGRDSHAADQHPRPVRNVYTHFGQQSHSVFHIDVHWAGRVDARRRRRFAKRTRVSRLPSIVLVNPAVSVTSPIEKVGSRWLWRRWFGASQRISWGHISRRAPLPTSATKRRRQAMTVTIQWPADISVAIAEQWDDVLRRARV